ncbi:hypothetical protein C8A00DRAFT_19691 [Chaetomidium leptoderma]|uniref:Uncharacterized protein n=1 Tax=Chaetomidium leptoderma TaxID=669021 RepID=A0AAN6VCE5_9PEZI|nr:hypothetical protein C8A00DRAFT_19691 [Chaetomidium leptoderma]
MVRDGLTNITKVEFLSVIQGVRRKAFKESTIIAAFKKTGIWPFNPQVVLQVVRDRQARRTPSPPPMPDSSPFSTPLTLRQINRVAERLEDIMERQDNIDLGFADDLQRFIRGSLITATELVQVKRDLQRTKMAEAVALARRHQKNRPLQSGGVLTAAQARRIVKQRDEDEVAKARRVVEQAETRERNALKRWFAAATKEGRKWRMTGKLSPMEVIESGKEKRLLRRV